MELIQQMQTQLKFLSSRSGRTYAEQLDFTLGILSDHTTGISNLKTKSQVIAFLLMRTTKISQLMTLRDPIAGQIVQIIDSYVENPGQENETNF